MFCYSCDTGQKSQSTKILTKTVNNLCLVLMDPVIIFLDSRNCDYVSTVYKNWQVFCATTRSCLCVYMI